ncbi:MAG: methylmalonyl-CoA epimerase [Acidobacteriia bacterium]|nr:methylmalonyl-CoA epimerase [Terriglobia bacterium]
MRAVEHIGIAVRSIEERLPLYRALGFEVGGREEVGSEKVRVAFLLAAGTRIELLEPTAPDSPIRSFLTKRGEGMHHICFQVDDIRATMTELRTKGFRLLSDEPRSGANGSQVCFIHPSSGGGVLIELSQPGE